MKEFNFTLSDSLKYSHEGKDTDATFIVLTGPSIAQLDANSELKKAFHYSARKASQDSDDSEGGEAEEVTAEIIMALLYQYFPDMKQVFGVAKKLFYSNGIASVEGVADFKPAHYNTMSIDDFERMVGEYLVNFTLASALNQGSSDLKSEK